MLFCFMLQGIESDELRDPLTVFSETMNKVRAMLFPASSKRGDVAPNLEETVEKEHKRLLARQSIIEKRKEEQERQQLEMVCLFLTCVKVGNLRQSLIVLCFLF